MSKRTKRKKVHNRKTMKRRSMKRRSLNRKTKKNNSLIIANRYKVIKRLNKRKYSGVTGLLELNSVSV